MMCPRWWLPTNAEPNVTRARTLGGHGAAFERACVGLLLLHFLGAGNLAGQGKLPAPTIVPGTVECAKCTIKATKEWSFVEESGDLVPKSPYSVKIDSKGRVIVGRGPQGPPIIFDKQGRYVKTLGLVGDGPGESRNVDILLLTEGDSIVALDRRLSRMSVYAPDGRSIRQAPVPARAFDAAWSPSGTVILQAEVRDRERFGKPLHALDRVGNYLRSFGGTGESIIPLQPASSASKHVSASGPSSVWMIPSYGHFLIERWTIAGQRTSAWSIELPWFPHDEEYRWFTQGGPGASPSVAGLVEGADNRLWIAAKVPDPNWRNTVKFARGEGGRMAAVVDDYDKAVDTVVLLVDTRTGRVQAMQRFDQNFITWVGPGKLFRHGTDDNGKTTLEIVSLALVPAPGS